jgi:hypothetical protein
MIFEPENRAEKKWMLKFMKGNRVFVSQSTKLGDALDSLVKIVESGLVDLVFVDSLAALAVKEMKGKGTEGDHMALVARKLPQFFQIATEPVAESQTAVVFVHQMRSSMEMYSAELETYNGGNALKHMLSLVLNLRRASTSKDADKGERFKGIGTKKLGFMTNFKCIKGGIGSIQEGDSIQMDFFHRKGFVDVSSIVHFAIRNNVIVKDGPGKYRLTDTKGTYSQRGLDNVIRDFTEDKELQGRALSLCKSYLQDPDFVMEDIAPDLEFEEKQLDNTNEVQNTTEELQISEEEKGDAVKKTKTNKDKDKDK